MLARERGKQKGKLTVGADRGYNTRGFVAGTRALSVTPHVARKRRYNAIDARTTSWPGYDLSQRRRKVIEEAFGWMKTTGPLGKLLHAHSGEFGRPVRLKTATWSGSIRPPGPLHWSPPGAAGDADLL